MKPSVRLSGLATIAIAFMTTTALAQSEVIKGQVKKIDGDSNKITLTTGPIKSLDMDDDNMTMVYRVKDPAMLGQVKAGDKVQFEFQSGPDGITITKMQKTR